MKQQIIDLLNKMFAPRVTKTYTYNGRVANEKEKKEMNRVSEHMNNSFKEMEKAFEVLEKI